VCGAGVLLPDAEASSVPMRTPKADGFFFIPSLELHLTKSELWFGQEQEGILP